MPEQQPMKLSTLVRYAPRRLPPFYKAYLELTQDDRVQLRVVEGETGERIEFNLPIGEVTQFTVLQGAMTLKIRGKAYNLEIGRYGTVADIGATMGGVAGLATIALSEQMSDVRQWIDALRTAGVPVRHIGAMWILRAALLLSAGIIILAFIMNAIFS